MFAIENFLAEQSKMMTVQTAQRNTFLHHLRTPLKVDLNRNALAYVLENGKGTLTKKSNNSSLVPRQHICCGDVPLRHGSTFVLLGIDTKTAAQ